MNPRLVLLIVLVAIVAVAFLAYVAYRGIRANAGVRRKEFELMRRERNAAYDAVNSISEICSEYKEIDSPLASKLNPLIARFNTERWEIRK